MEIINNFLASTHYLNHPVISFISGSCLVLIGIFILSRNIRSELHRAFFLIVLSPGIWFFGNALSMFYFNDLNQSVFWYKVGYSSVLFMALADYNFFLAYFKKRKTFLYYFFYAISLLEFIYVWFFYNIDVNIIYSLPNVGVVYAKFFALPTLFFFFGMIKYIIVLSIISIFFWVEYKKEHEASIKKQLKWLTIIFFLLAWGWLEWLVIFNIPLHIAWVLVPPISVSIVYSIFRYELLGISIIIKKAFFYSLGIALISGLIFGVSFLNSWFAEHISGFRPWMIPLISGIVAFIIGNIFWRKSKEVDKLKYEFITVAAHKLRTPLTDIKWAAASLKDVGISEKDKSKLVNGIILAVERLVDLTNELLAIAKTEAGQYQYNIEAADFEQVVRKVVNDFQLQMREKGIKFKYNTEKNLPKVRIDKVRINSVVRTLLENAILYTKNEIKINIDVYKNNIIFHIEDNGIGISKEDQLYIFSKFFRTKDAYITETEGAGVGLFLAKSITEKHGGKIGVRSEGKDKGSIFWFSLPIS